MIAPPRHSRRCCCARRRSPIAKVKSEADRLNPWVIERYGMHCTYSPKLPVSAEQLDKILLQLRDQGIIEQWLNAT